MLSDELDERSLPEVRGVQHRFVIVHGVNLHYAEAGSGELVILLHGWPQHWYEWRHQIGELAASYRVICPDFRGFGWSDAPPSAYDKEQLAADIVGLLDALGIEQCRLLTHDWGAWVGYLICLRYPGRVQRHVALSVPPPFLKPHWSQLAFVRSWYMLVIATPWLGYLLIRHQVFVKRILRWGYRRKRWSTEELNIYASRLAQRPRAKASVMLYRTFVLREFIPTVLGRYRSQRLLVPTLLLAGTRDFFISSRAMYRNEAYAADLRVEIMPHCGHFLAEEAPEFVTRRARAFFAESSGES
jgi:pimeloyl-ACP methyl ester carboxylesterase